MKTSPELTQKLDQLQNRGLLAGGFFLVVTLAGWALAPGSFFQAYLFGYLFWFGITLGSMAILMLHHMVGGAWGFVIRRLMEATTRTLPTMLLLFLPLFVGGVIAWLDNHSGWGLQTIYEWARPEAASDEVLVHKAPYLNMPFFLVRSVLYFALWYVFGYVVNLRSVQQDQTGDPGITRKLQLISGPGLVMLGGTVTFASIDWLMSLEPHWFSTIYGLTTLEGFGLSGLAFAVLALRFASRYEPLSSVVTKKNFHDLGNLLLAFVMLWAYLNFSQYLIIWSGNLPEEIPWYLNRSRGGWQYVALALILFHFAIPFALLLSRTTKTRARMLSALAGTLLLLRGVDYFFLIAPALRANLSISWMDVTAWLGVGGIWLGVFAFKVKDRALLPIHDPRLEDALGKKEALEHA